MLFSFRTKGVLYHFVTDFVQKVFLGQIRFAVTDKTRIAARGLDALKNLTDQVTQNALRADRPLLKVLYPVQLGSYETEYDLKDSLCRVHKQPRIMLIGSSFQFCKQVFRL